MVVLDTIPVSDEKKKNEKIKVLSVASVFAEAMSNIHNNDSVSKIFNR